VITHPNVPRRVPQHAHSSRPPITLASRLILVVGARVRVRVTHALNQLLEVLCLDRTVLTTTDDPRILDVALLDPMLLAELSSTGGDLHLGVLLGRGGRRLEVFDILEQDLALRTGAGHFADVDAVVPRELLSRRRGVDLALLGSLRKLLKILHADLIAVGSTLEVIRHNDPLGLRKLLRGLASEAGDLLNLRGLHELLRQQGLAIEELEGRLAIARLVLEELVDDRGEGLRRGSHEYRVCCVC